MKEDKDLTPLFESYGGDVREVQSSVSIKFKAPKMSHEEACAVVALQEKMREVLEEVESFNKELLEKYGEGTFVYKMDDEEKPYLKITLTDNAKKVANGEFYKACRVPPVSVDIRRLKNRQDTKLSEVEVKLSGTNWDKDTVAKFIEEWRNRNE